MVLYLFFSVYSIQVVDLFIKLLVTGVQIFIVLNSVTIVMMPTFLFIFVFIQKAQMNECSYDVLLKIILKMILSLIQLLTHYVFNNSRITLLYTILEFVDTVLSFRFVCEALLYSARSFSYGTGNMQFLKYWVVKYFSSSLFYLN